VGDFEQHRIGNLALALAQIFEQFDHELRFLRIRQPPQSGEAFKNHLGSIGINTAGSISFPAV